MVLKLKISFFLPVLFILFLSCNRSQKERKRLTGNEIYLGYCNSCHGEDGKKGLAGASDLSASALSREEAIEVIASGRNGMVGFASILSKEEINAVVGYIDTLKNEPGTGSK